MKVLTLLGTRPEIIRLSRVIERLDESCDHLLVHTGQNFDERLSRVFFRELGIRDPDLNLGVRGGGFGERVGAILAATERLVRERRPDRLLVLGDTDSGLAAFVAKRMGVPVFHMEAGNRCFDDRVPEEVNRRLIDHSSDVLMPYTQGSRRNLLREGFEPQRVLVTGNPIKEVLDRHADQVDASAVHRGLGIEPGGYVLLTAHRQETVDVEQRLRNVVEGALMLADEARLPLVVSLHPRTRSRVESWGVDLDSDGVIVSPPFGFFDFVALERGAALVMTDSGTVQEECCILGVPAVTVRDATERPETIECGSNVLSGTRPDSIRRCARAALELPRDWTSPPEYLAPEVSATVLKILLGQLPAGASAEGPRERDAGEVGGVRSAG